MNFQIAHLTKQAALMTTYIYIVGSGGSLIDSLPFVLRVAGSNPALAAT